MYFLLPQAIVEKVMLEEYLLLVWLAAAPKALIVKIPRTDVQKAGLNIWKLVAQTEPIILRILKYEFADASLVQDCVADLLLQVKNHLYEHIWVKRAIAECALKVVEQVGLEPEDGLNFHLVEDIEIVSVAVLEVVYFQLFDDVHVFFLKHGLFQHVLVR